jgi:hypothetical protein
MSTKTLHDNIDDFDLQLVSAQSMSFILEDLVLDANEICTLDLSDPMHHVQRMHACILAIRGKLEEIKVTVHGMGGSAA